jgi:hypothetical protein
MDSAVGAAGGIIRSFVSQGGGLLTGAQAWSFDDAVELHPANQVLIPMGIVSVAAAARGW